MIISTALRSTPKTIANFAPEIEKTMTDPRNIKIEDYNYPLPDERIAKYPVKERDTSKLLVYRHGEIIDDRFYDLPHYLDKGELLVFNNTKVIRARLHFHKETGALIEVFCLEPHAPRDYEQMFQAVGRCEWVCLIGNRKKWKEGSLCRTLKVKGGDVELKATVKDAAHDIVEFSWGGEGLSFAEILDAAGELPIPPYLNRETEQSDLQTYQTVYSKIKGSVAAPTAGLHFTPRVLETLDKKGVERNEITLHVGAGTFKPVKTETMAGHVMHHEFISVKRSSIERLIVHGGKCVAVGTTSVRTLESLYYIGVLISRNPDADEKDLAVNQWFPYEYAESGEKPLTTLEALGKIVEYLDRNNLHTLTANTQIIIAPGYDYHIVKAIITNFHQPKSTLLLLVSALVGENWHKIYRHALDNDFRFLSYGDSSLLIP